MNNLRLHQPVAVGGLMVLPSLCVTFYFRAVSIFPHNQPHAASWAPWLLFRFISRLTQFLLHCLRYFFLVLTFNRQAAFPSRSPSSLIQSCTKLSSVFHNLVVQWLAYYSTIVVLRLVHGVSAVVPPASSSSSLQSYFCFFLFIWAGDSNFISSLSLRCSHSCVGRLQLLWENYLPVGVDWSATGPAVADIFLCSSFIYIYYLFSPLPNHKSFITQPSMCDHTELPILPPINHPPIFNINRSNFICIVLKQIGRCLR